MEGASAAHSCRFAEHCTRGADPMDRSKKAIAVRCSATAGSRAKSIPERHADLPGPAAHVHLDVVKRVVDVEGLTCRLEVSTVSATTVLLMTAIWFPRDADGIARMRRTQVALRTRLRATGYHPARDGVDAVRDEGPAGGALARIKAALDPAGILSPGRYL